MVSCGTTVAPDLSVPPARAHLIEASRSSESPLFGNLVWVLFVAAQAADGVCTYVGLHVFGVGMEGNPLIEWYAATFGVGAALVGAKLLAAGCAAFLHHIGRHRTLASLTILYLLAAVRPWAELLWP